MAGQTVNCALLGAAASAGQVAGPLAASAALALSGFPAAFIVDAASYLIGAAVIAPLPLRPGPAPMPWTLRLAAPTVRRTPPGDP